jgi:hypothetical protein
MKTKIIVDPMGVGGLTPEQEIEQHKIKFSALIYPLELEIIDSSFSPVIPDGTELVIYDFGGMLPGTSLMEDNARYVVKWASDHPNSLVVVVSDYTYNVYIKQEMIDLGMDDLYNIILDSYKIDDPLPKWFRDFYSIPPINKEKLDEVFDKCYAIKYPVEEKPIKKSPIKRKKVAKKLETSLVSVDPLIVNDKTIEEKPRMPVAYITVPVQCDWKPGQKSGTMRFKLADCIVDVSEGEGKDEKLIAHVGGEFFGFYGITFPNGEGNHWHYSIHPEDFYAAFLKMHNELIEKEKEE